MAARLTLEALVDGRWQKAAALEFPEEARGDRGQCFFEYDYAYLDAWLAQPRFDTQASVALPLEFGPTISASWPLFLDDVRPMGNARRWWLARLSLPDAPGSDFQLLAQGTVAPVGNLRIAESVPPRPELLVDYVQRDLLNLVFGNSDNHGRNTALLKSANAVSLAPVYDFAPMKMDLEGITRTTQWGAFERGGDVEWRAVLPTFGAHEALVRDGLRALSARLTELPALLRELGLPNETLEFPGLGLLRTEARLRAWGLL